MKLPRMHFVAKNLKRWHEKIEYNLLLLQKISRKIVKNGDVGRNVESYSIIG
jgi:hypothetical protein